MNGTSIGWIVACYGAFVGFYLLLYRRAERRGDTEGLQWGWLGAVTAAAAAVALYWALTT